MTVQMRGMARTILWRRRRDWVQPLAHPVWTAPEIVPIFQSHIVLWRKELHNTVNNIAAGANYETCLYAFEN